jgi:hypothetical protein
MKTYLYPYRGKNSNDSRFLIRHHEGKKEVAKYFPSDERK